MRSGDTAAKMSAHAPLRTSFELLSSLFMSLFGGEEKVSFGHFNDQDLTLNMASTKKTKQ